MKKLLAAPMSVAVLAALSPLAEAQSPCPPEVAQAKRMMSKHANVTQAPRALAGARGQDVQAGRGQDIQAPRSLAGARGQDVQAGRGQDVQAGRGQNVQAGRATGAARPGSDMTKISGLVKQAEAACKAGDMKTAKSKAEAAIATMK